MKSVLLAITTVIVLGNLLLLDWKIVFTPAPDQALQTAQSNNQITPQNSDCLSQCLYAIHQAVYNATMSANTTIIPTPPPKQLQSGATTSDVKEFFVPFGSGSSSSNDWQDVLGLQAYVDTSYYGRIKQVLFEASVHVPTGNETVSVRLYNATDQHPVWYSDVFFNSGTSPALLVSQPVTLDTGNKLYKVQMETQLTYPAVLDQARLHIITY